jgi:hypothetical protein
LWNQGQTIDLGTLGGKKAQFACRDLAHSLTRCSSRRESNLCLGIRASRGEDLPSCVLRVRLRGLPGNASPSLSNRTG